MAIQQETGLLQISDITLEQWYQDRKLHIINLAECAATSRAHCQRLEAQLAEVAVETDELTALLQSADKEGMSGSEAARCLAKLDKEIGENRHKLVSTYLDHIDGFRGVVIKSRLAG